MKHQRVKCSCLGPAMMLGTASACFWHEPLLLLATCFNKTANDNHKTHFSFLIKSFKNIKSTHDLNFLKSHIEVIFQKQMSAFKLWITENWIGLSFCLLIYRGGIWSPEMFGNLLMALGNFLGQVNLSGFLFVCFNGPSPPACWTGDPHFYFTRSPVNYKTGRGWSIRKWI